MNRVVLIGNLTKDPELQKVKDDISVCRINIAVERKIRSDVDYFNIVTWNSQAESCAKYLKKGSKVAIFGEIQMRKYADASGQTRYVTEIKADEVQFIGTPRTETNTELQEVRQEDLPF